MGRLDSKVAVITGSSSGIGAATAKLLAQEGAKVVVVSDQNVAGGQDVVSSIEAEGREALFVQADVSKEPDCKRVMDTAVTTFGRLDILVNNAAVGTLAPVTELTEEEYDYVMDTNVKGVFFCCKYAIPYMKQVGGGAIVTISSRCAFIPQPLGSAVYSASKAACLAWTHAVAQEYAKDGIRANTILPSAIWTDKAKSYISSTPDPEATREWFETSQPLGRAGEPEEVATAILFLVSDDASFITSTPLLVDGGFFFSAGGMVPKSV